MKKTILTLLIVGTTCGSSFAKPGGWIKDFLSNSSFQASSSSGYYYQPAYYQPAPQQVYYYQQPVGVYEQPRYYYQPQPQYIPMRPYQQNTSSFYWQGNNYRHCR